MKKLLFVINNFKTGGIQKSLIELLSQISNDYDITLYATDLIGPYTTQLPQNVKVLKSSRFAQMLEYPRWEYRKIGGLFNYLVKLFFGWLTSKSSKRLAARLYCRMLGLLPGEYDWAISYSQPIGDTAFHNLENEIVLYCTKAKHRATFVHCDYEEYGGNTPYNHSLYKQFDAVAAVSQSVAKRFCQVLPDMQNKVFVVYNACNAIYIQKQSLVAPVCYKKKCIVSVCRLSPVKGLLRCVPIFRQLRDESYDFEWHIIGGGDDDYLEKMNSVIKEIGMEQTIIMEGEQTNPYRFMKNADFLFLPSFHEAAPMVFNEACCLGLRIITTDTLSANELVANREIGIVCENSEDSIYAKLKQALNNVLPVYEPNKMEQWNNIVKEQFGALLCNNRLS